MSLKDLSARLGVKSPTMHSLLQTLAASGYVERRQGPTRYMLGPAVHELSDRHRRRSLLLRAETVLAQLARQLPQATLTYSEPLGGEVAVLLRLAPGSARMEAAS